MCGIFGSINTNSLKDTHKGLSRLEYRGYDSFGYAAKRGDDVEVAKGLGSVDRAAFEKEDADLCIGHVRWATNGEVTIKNAHPQKFENFYVVHNGVVENAPLHILDTKWIANLLWLYQGNPKRVYDHIAGDNAFVFLNSETGEVWCVAKGNKRLFMTENGYVSSDILALAGFSDKASKLENGFALLGDVLPNQTSLVPNNVREHGPNRMFTEIWEQAELDGGQRHNFDCDIMDIIATGSSLYAAMFGGYFLEEQGISTRCIHASQANHYNLHQNVLAISQSGETKDIIGAVPDDFVCMTNTPDSMLYDMAYKKILLEAGPEYAVAATKTFTASCMKLCGIVEPMTKQINNLMKRASAIKGIAKRIMGYDHFLFLGDRQNYPIALEGALKFKEVAYVHAEGMPASEMKHGPIALVDYKVPSLFVVTENFRLETISNIKEIRSRKGFVVIITHDAIRDKLEGLGDIIFSCKDTGEKYSQSLVCNVVLQLLAYYIAVERGINPDKPKNLAKCVTV